VLIGGEGDDTLSGGGGDDEYRGGPGENTIAELASGGTGDTVVETYNGDFTLTETVLAWSNSGLVGSDESLENIENVRLTGGAADNIFTISPLAHGSIWVVGGQGFDSLVLGPYKSTVTLAAGSIVVDGVQSVHYDSIERLNIGGITDVAADLVSDYGEWLEGGAITPVGPNPKSAAGKVNALGNMLIQAQTYLEAGDFDAAITQLEDALSKCDGDDVPADFVTDEGGLLKAAIEALLDLLS
jgi:hypothetical protein